MSAVVVGYVASAEGAAAVRQGITEAKLRQCKIVVVYSDNTDKLDAALAAEHAEALDVARGLLEESDVESDLRHLTQGKDPVTDVLDAADELNAELIVIGIRKRTPVGKLVLGSHSQSILLEAAIPVLAVKA